MYFYVTLCLDEDPEESVSEIEDFLAEVNSENQFLLSNPQRSPKQTNPISPSLQSKPRRSPKQTPPNSPSKLVIEEDKEEYINNSQKRQLYEKKADSPSKKYTPPSKSNFNFCWL